MKKHVRLTFLVLLILLFAAGCAPAPEEAGIFSPSRPSAGDTASKETGVPATASRPSTGENAAGAAPSAEPGQEGFAGYDGLLKLLEESGMQYTEEEPQPVDRHSFLSVAYIPLWIGEELLQVYEYPSSEEMEADAGTISKNGSSNGRMMVEWAFQPHFFKKDAMIICYVGIDEDILAILNEHFGEEFAGAKYQYELG